MSSLSEADAGQPQAPASTPAGTTGAAPRDAKGGLVPADCGCGCGGHGGGECSCGAGAANAPKKTQLVYAIGQLGVSFVSQARRDSIWRALNRGIKKNFKPVADATLLELFAADLHYAQSVVWTLSRTDVPMYAIIPAGAFAAETYRWMIREWADSNVEFISLPGVMAGQIALYYGQIVDVVVPDLRGMFSWDVKSYRDALREARRKAEPTIPDDQLDRELGRFLGKMNYSVRNRGVLPAERALNAAAVNALNFSDVIVEAGSEGLTLRDVAVEPSPLNRPGSEYHDVLLTFFDPKDRQGRASLRARFTVDVSDTVPVLIGEPSTWNEY